MPSYDHCYRLLEQSTIDHLTERYNYLAKKYGKTDSDRTINYPLELSSLLEDIGKVHSYSSSYKTSGMTRKLNKPYEEIVDKINALQDQIVKDQNQPYQEKVFLL